MFPFEVDREDRPWLGALAILALAQAIVLFAVGYRLADNHFMFPLDDAYIHLQYARMVAAGAPFVYSPGMEPSGGATSPLYVLLMTPLFLLQFWGAKGAFVAYLFGAATWMLFPVWMYQLVKRLANGTLAIVAGLLSLAHGWFLWNFLSGMETGLFTLLTVGIVLAATVHWQTEAPYARRMLYVGLALLPICRPEGIVAVIAVAGLVLARRGEPPRLGLLPVLACALPWVLWLGTLHVLTGSWKPAGLQVKGLNSFPYWGVVERLAFASDTLQAIPFRFYNNISPDPGFGQFKGTQHFPLVAPGLGLLAALGAGLGVFQEGKARRPGPAMLLAVFFLLGSLSLAGSLLPFSHQFRYLVPWAALALVLAMVALRRIGQLFAQLEELFLKAAGLGMIVLVLPSVPFWMAEWGRNSRDIYHVLRVATFPLEADGPPMAITDAGILAYYTNRPVVDLIGLGSSEFSATTQHGEGAILEALAEMPQEQRPLTLISYPQWWSERFPLGESRRLSWVPYTSITSGVELKEWPILWPLIEAGSTPLAALEDGEEVLLDLDVANLASEKAHGYEFRVGIYDPSTIAWPRPLTPVERFWAIAGGNGRNPESGIRNQRDLGASAVDGATTEGVVMEPAEPEGVAAPEEAVLVEGGRVNRAESFVFAPPGGYPGPGVVLRARLAHPRHDGAPHIRGYAVNVAVVSNTTGFRAVRNVPLLQAEVEGGPLPSYLEVPLSELLDEAGGTAWRIEVDAGGSTFASYRYGVVRLAPHDRDPGPGIRDPME